MLLLRSTGRSNQQGNDQKIVLLSYLVADAPGRFSGCWISNGVGDLGVSPLEIWGVGGFLLLGGKKIPSDGTPSALVFLPHVPCHGALLSSCAPACCRELGAACCRAARMPLPSNTTTLTCLSLVRRGPSFHSFLQTQINQPGEKT